MVNYNKILTLSLATAFILMSAACLSSCSDEDLAEPAGERHTITLNITPVDNEKTRVATNADRTTSECYIHRLAIAIVDPKSKQIIGGVHEEEISNQQASGTVAFTYTNAQIKDGDLIAVAVNCPAGKFSGKTSYEDFKRVTLTADEALNQDGEEYASYSNLPMYGEATASFNGTDYLTADVFVYHMVTKVSLNSLTVDLRSSGDTFTPEQIFISNVVDGISLAPINNYTFTTSSGTLDGNYSSGSSNSRLYLTTASSSSNKNSFNGSTTSSGTIEYKTLPKFYVTPNTKTAEGGAGATMLVIQGTYKQGGTGDGKTVYYSMFINYNNETDKSCDGHTAKTLWPNVNYVMDVTIKGEGMEKYDDATSVGIVSTKSQYRDFSATTTPVVVGEYLFNDGSWGPYDRSQRQMINSSHYPVGIIFSNSTSAIDQSNGWTHGYAVAINKCGAGMYWASSSALYGHSHTDITESNYKSPFGATDKTAWINDLDGYTETQHVITVSDYTGATKKGKKQSYPAFFYAVKDGTDDVGLTNYFLVYNTDDYTVGDKTNIWTELDDDRSTLGLQMASGTNTSGWYLGSIGQYYLMAKNLWYPTGSSTKFNDGNVVQTVSGSTPEWAVKNWVTNNTEEYFFEQLIIKGQTFYCSITDDLFGTNSVVLGGATYVTNGYRPVIYWTSSEYSADYAYQLRIVPKDCSSYTSSRGNIVVAVAKKSTATENTDCVGIRPVIAF